MISGEMKVKPENLSSDINASYNEPNILDYSENDHVDYLEQRTSSESLDVKNRISHSFPRKSKNIHSMFQRVCHKFRAIRRSRYTVLLSVAWSMMADMAFYGMYLALWDITSKNLPSELTSEIYSMYAIGLIICSMLGGIISDALNSRRKPAIIGSLIGIISVTLSIVGMSSFSIIMIARTLHGFSSSVVYVICMALIPDTFPAHKVTSAMAFLYTADAFGQFLGPVIVWILVKDYENDCIYAYGFLIAIHIIDFLTRIMIRPINIFLSQKLSKRHRPGNRYLEWEESAKLEVLYSEDDEHLDREHESQEAIEIESVCENEESLPDIPKSDVYTIESLSEQDMGSEIQLEESSVPITVKDQIYAWINSFVDTEYIIGTDDEALVFQQSIHDNIISGFENIESESESITSIQYECIDETLKIESSMDLKAIETKKKRHKRFKSRIKRYKKRKRTRTKVTCRNMNPIVLLKHTEILMCCIIVMLGAISTQINETIVYSMAKRKYDMKNHNETYLQMCFVIPSILASLALGSVSNKLRGSRIVMIGFLLHIISLPLIPLCPNLILFTLALCLYSISRTILTMPVIAEMGYALICLKESDSIAKVYGLYNCSYGIGMLIATPLSRVFYYIYSDDSIAFLAFPIINSVLFPFYVLYSLRVERKRQLKSFEWRQVLKCAIHDLFYDPWRQVSESEENKIS